MRATRAPLIFAILFAAVYLTASCSKGERADAMERQVIAKIRKGISIGDGKTDVESFVDFLEIDSRKFTRYGYKTDLSGSQLLVRAKENDPNSKAPSGVKGYFRASMSSVDTDYSVLATVDMHLEFYFDERERLVNYLIYQFKHP